MDTPPCTCQIIASQSGFRIEYCSLHREAEDLLRELESVVGVMRDGSLWPLLDQVEQSRVRVAELVIQRVRRV